VWPRHLLLIAAAVAPSAPVLAGDHVTITGGADVTGQNYRWIVQHDYSSPIVSIEFPHYMADWFGTPDGWTQELTAFLGQNGKSGVCRAESDEGLPAGVRGIFDLRVGPRGTPRGEGNVVVRFADGTQESVRAEVPVQESFLAQHIALIGLGVVFGLLLLIHWLRKRGEEPATPADEP